MQKSAKQQSNKQELGSWSIKSLLSSPWLKSWCSSCFSPSNGKQLWILESFDETCTLYQKQDSIYQRQTYNTTRRWCSLWYGKGATTLFFHGFQHLYLLILYKAPFILIILFNYGQIFTVIFPSIIWSALANSLHETRWEICDCILRWVKIPLGRPRSS